MFLSQSVTISLYIVTVYVKNSLWTKVGVILYMTPNVLTAEYPNNFLSAGAWLCEAALSCVHLCMIFALLGVLNLLRLSEIHQPVQMVYVMLQWVHFSHAQTLIGGCRVAFLIEKVLVLRRHFCTTAHVSWHFPAMFHSVGDLSLQRKVPTLQVKIITICNVVHYQVTQ